MPVGVNGYCFHNSSLRILLSLRDQSADWSWQSVPHAAGCRHPALRIKLNLCRAGPVCPVGRVPWLTGGELRAARPPDSRKIYASPGSGRRDAGPYRQKQKVLAVGPMWASAPTESSFWLCVGRRALTPPRSSRRGFPCFARPAQAQSASRMGTQRRYERTA